jgi:hypothetical protein
MVIQTLSYEAFGQVHIQVQVFELEGDGSRWRSWRRSDVPAPRGHEEWGYADWAAFIGECVMDVAYRDF